VKIMEVADIGTRPPITCAPETTLREAAGVMLQHNVGSVIAVDPHGHMVGIITDRDIVVRAIAHGMGLDTPIRAVMSHPVVCVYEEDDPFTAATRMASARCRRLPVLDARGSLSAVVTLDDLISVFAEQTEKLAYAVRSEIGGMRPAGAGAPVG
jgi:signal-transduction protein with cAMP-binding, CBS, and nucleotidyltransferase domain